MIEQVRHFESELRTWMWLAVMLAIILFKGFFSFFCGV